MSCLQLAWSCTHAPCAFYLSQHIFPPLLEEQLLIGWETLLVHFCHGWSANTFFNLEVWADTKARFPWSWLQSLLGLTWFDYPWAEVWFRSQTFFSALFSWRPDSCTSQDLLPNPNVKLHLLHTSVVEDVSKPLLSNRPNAHRLCGKRLWWTCPQICRLQQPVYQKRIP